jgi:hypothetical protein
MDLPSALFAVFLLDFSSDRVKNLISKIQDEPNAAKDSNATNAARRV